jgi:type I restriction-modification system DNA methylase subunit
MPPIAMPGLSAAFYPEQMRDGQWEANVDALAEAGLKAVRIAEFCWDRLEPEPGRYPATLDEITENEFNLNIPRYVDTFEPEPEVDIPSVKKEIAAIENELAGVEKELAGHLKELGL